VHIPPSERGKRVHHPTRNEIMSSDTTFIPPENNNMQHPAPQLSESPRAAKVLASGRQLTQPMRREQIQNKSFRGQNQLSACFFIPLSAVPATARPRVTATFRALEAEAGACSALGAEAW